MSGFGARFGALPRWAARAPGRVNLIGEHTDYNGGLVLPMAIDRECWAVGGPARDGGVSRLYSTDLDVEVAVDLRAPIVAGAGAAVIGSPMSYVLGVLAQFQRRCGGVPNVEVAVASSVPLGGGLSSSASLEVAVATLMEAVLDVELGPLEKARLCQRAEHEFAGVPCGLMDQMASVGGVEGHALLIDCGSDAMTPVAIPDGAGVLVVNTNVRHALASGEYAVRRAACERAAAKLGLGSLRDADAGVLAGAGLSEEERRCVRHVVTENARVLMAAEALRAGDLQGFGVLMRESHASLRDDYRVSCAELDLVVATLDACGGVYGARMTGAGFGGCAVALVEPGEVGRVSERVAARYAEVTGGECGVFAVRAAGGCSKEHGPPQDG